MKHDERYHGHRIVVTTTQTASGRWTARAELVDAPASAGDGDAAEFGTEEEARRAGLSRAAAAIDRARQGKGKP